MADRRSNTKVSVNQITKVGGMAHHDESPPSSLQRDPLHVNNHLQVP